MTSPALTAVNRLRRLAEKLQDGGDDARWLASRRRKIDRPPKKIASAWMGRRLSVTQADILPRTGSVGGPQRQQQFFGMLSQAGQAIFGRH